MIAPPAITIVVPAVALPDLDRVSECIRQVERWQHHPVGRHHERSDWQFTEETWKESTDLPWSMAFNEEVARAVARSRLVAIRDGLQREHLDPSVYNMALAWNGGRSRVILKKWQPLKVRDYAQRVENLYFAR